MQFAEAADLVKAIPVPRTHPTRGRVLYRHIRRTKPKKLLELGTARGGSAVYTAAALEANGAGHLTTVDRLTSSFADPTPEEVLDKAGLSDWVTLDRSFSTYTWFLKSEIEKNLRKDGTVRPVYDFIFLDGCKNWSTDGLAVVLAEKLLRPGGWLLLDDLGWSYGKHPKKSRHYGIEIATLSDEEREQPHLRAIFDLLIMNNPAFDDFVIQDDWWGWARKSPTARRGGAGVLSGKPMARDEPTPSQPSGTTSPSVRTRLVQQVGRRMSPEARSRVRALQRKAARLSKRS